MQTVLTKGCISYKISREKTPSPLQTILDFTQELWVFSPKYFSLKFSLCCSVFSICLVFSGFDFEEKIELILSMPFLSFHTRLYFLENLFLLVFGVFLALFLFTWDVFFLCTVFPLPQLHLFSFMLFFFALAFHFIPLLVCLFFRFCSFFRL